MRWLRISTASVPSRARRAAPALALLMLACSREQPRQPGQDAAVEAVAAERAGLGEPGVRGRGLYRTYCAICHGATGAGDGFNAYNLTPPPPDLRAAVTTRGDVLVSQIMRDGSASVGRSPLCPPFGRTLDDADRGLLLVYLREGLKPTVAP